MNGRRVCAIILAAGSGTRMNLGVTKQTITINGKTVLKRSLLAFEACDDITDIILVAREDEIEFAASQAVDITKLRKIVVGGKTRPESAKYGFLAIDFPCDMVAIHDAARCLISPDLISKVLGDAMLYGASSASSVVVDTVKRVDASGFVIGTEQRKELRLAGTPQIFNYELYSTALKAVDTSDPTITDDNMLMERIGVRVYMTDVGKNNIKITHADDISLAEYFLERYDG